ncbi:16S rRNA (guanine(527)-N(7))-methyltransferase RsmG [Palleronia sp. LCG004]|uniref:16S rRNA (guanine(527)-N(7))-methyltransferase RsmG n=1 Tax=Palleronia sp. LCG004 TaxID=3079304 RepID=UPI0029433D5B|nr:16S rRNA (guanine(527)-N(7))-methyltransferase RsmG [Palleronia sp. LCG004]WOI55944.1 16S rRNA (guanine(527)-N(7))-methyltransferase RsmG [Palleronia sp. LCG004]
MPDFGDTNVSHETLEYLAAYARELLKWNKRINLVGRATTDDVMSRHIDDSLQVYDAVENPTGIWCDLGSGGGLPAIVVAICARETALEVVCVESDTRKSAFLSHMARLLDLNVRVIIGRIEAVDPIKADIISARALAPLEKLLTFAERHAKPHGVCLFPKGETLQSEIHRASEEWQFSLEAIPSRTSSRSAILKITDIARVERT